MDIKYINLLLNKCLNFEKSKILFISYDKVNKDFVEKVVDQAKKKGIEDIVFDEEDIEITYKKLKEESIEEIENDSYFNKSRWDEYAEKNASFLMLETEFPHLLDDIEPEKVAKANFIKRKTRPVFREKETNYEIAWCIAALPNQCWANDIYNNAPDAYQKLEEAIYKMCMIDKDDPIKAWDEYLDTVKKRSEYLNSLGIKKLHYTNSLGTDLTVEYPNGSIWSSIADDLEHNMLVNMPSYEIFSSPDYRKTNGLVYSSKPLMYGGGEISDFYIEFSDGKVTNYKAEKGEELLKGIIESDPNACYLGETALVDYDSPISNTGIVFGTTLIDENASCHLALGDGFSICFKNGTNMSKDELLEKGINQSQNHVDFMIGTSDLSIEALTEKGVIPIFKDGNFVNEIK